MSGRGRRLAQCDRHRLQQLRPADGLVGVGLDVQLLLELGRCIANVRGMHDQRQGAIGRPLANGLGELHPRHAGHMVIQDGQVEGVSVVLGLVQCGEGLGPAAGLHHVGSEAAQVFLRHQAIGAVVVDDEDAAATHIGTGWGCRGGRCRGLGEPRRKGKGTADSQPALDLDLAVHQFHQMLGNA